MNVVGRIVKLLRENNKLERDVRWVVLDDAHRWFPDKYKPFKVTWKEFKRFILKHKHLNIREMSLKVLGDDWWIDTVYAYEGSYSSYNTEFEFRQIPDADGLEHKKTFSLAQAGLNNHIYSMITRTTHFYVQEKMDKFSEFDTDYFTWLVRLMGLESFNFLVLRTWYRRIGVHLDFTAEKNPAFKQILDYWVDDVLKGISDMSVVDQLAAYYPGYHYFKSSGELDYDSFWTEPDEIAWFHSLGFESDPCQEDANTLQLSREAYCFCQDTDALILTLEMR